MRILICKECGSEIIFTAKSSYKYYCDECKKKRQSQQVMESRLRRNPLTSKGHQRVIGVGSGKHPCNIPGPNNKGWKTGIVGYQRLFDLTKMKCNRCAKQGALIHHKDEDRYNNALNNLEILCKACHQAEHTQQDIQTGRYRAKTNDVNLSKGVSIFEANGETCDGNTVPSSKEKV